MATERLSEPVRRMEIVQDELSRMAAPKLTVVRGGREFSRGAEKDRQLEELQRKQGVIP